MNKVSARYFGIFLIFSFLSYGIGSGLMDNFPVESLAPEDVRAKKTQIITGGVLSSIFHTIFNVALLVIMFNILKAIHKQLSMFYLSAGLISTVLLAVGAIFLLTSIPLSSQFANVPPADDLIFSSFITLLTEINFYAYQIGMAIWGIGGLCFCYLLYNYRLVLPILPIVGFIGYVVFIAGTFFELFGFSIGVWLSIPGGLFEVALAFWLIVKGFNKSPKKVNEL